MTDKDKRNKKYLAVILIYEILVSVSLLLGCDIGWETRDGFCHLIEIPFLEVFFVGILTLTAYAIVIFPVAIALLIMMVKVLVYVATSKTIDTVSKNIAWTIVLLPFFVFFALYQFTAPLIMHMY